MSFALFKHILNIGLTYDEFIAMTKDEVENPDKMKNKNYFEYTKLNLQRMNRGDKVYKVSEELTSLLQNITTPQLWLLITENWCGDSSQILPFINKASDVSEHITLKIVLRDANPDIMDLYTTNGARAIPKLVVFDKNQNELFRWGARPAEAQNIVTEAKKAGKSKDEFTLELHKWYAKNKGKAIDTEFVKIFSEIMK